MHLINLEKREDRIPPIQADLSEFNKTCGPGQEPQVFGEISRLL